MKNSKVSPRDAQIKVAIYARLSLDRHDTGLGVERQIQECREWAEQHGMTVLDRVYQDNDASATKGVRRKDFEALLQDLPGTGVAVLCWHTDRLIRLTSELERVINTGVIVYAVHAGRIDLSTPTGRAIARTVTAWATSEGEHKAERQIASHKQARNNGQPFHGGSRPFGYDKAIINGVRTYTINDTEAGYVREMYARFIKGHSLMSIASWLNEEGVATAYDPKKKDGPRPGLNGWRHTAVRQILMQPRNAGIVTYHGEEIGEGNWTALVPEATYRATVRQLTDPSRHTGGARKGKGGVVHSLIGVIECGICEAKARSGGKLYKCPNGHGSMHKDWIEDIVNAQVLTRLTGPVTAKANTVADVNSEAIYAELTDLRNYADELGTMLGKRQMTPKQFGDANTVVQEDIERLERALSSAGLHESLVELLDVEDLDLHWSTMDAPEKNRFLRRFYEKIVMVPRVGKVNPGECRGHAILVTVQNPEVPWEVKDEGRTWQTSAAEVRQWCRSMGYPVPDKGRIPYDLRLQYEQDVA